MKMRLLLHAVITLAVLAVCNMLVWQKEQVLTHGTTLLLRLAPVDPRSLMQGDYMALRYDAAESIVPHHDGDRRGQLVVHREENGVATVVGVARNQPLGPDQFLLRYHCTRDERAQVGANAFFFQEGQADLYAKAKYGELKVAPDGSSVLVGLRDEALQPLPRPAH